MSDAVEPLRHRLSAFLDAHDRPGCCRRRSDAVESGEIGRGALPRRPSPLMTGHRRPLAAGAGACLGGAPRLGHRAHDRRRALPAGAALQGAPAAPTGRSVVLACPRRRAARPRLADALRHVRHGGLDDVPAGRRHAHRAQMADAAEALRRGPRAHRVTTRCRPGARAARARRPTRALCPASASWWRDASRTARSGACGPTRSSRPPSSSADVGPPSGTGA